MKEFEKLLLEDVRRKENEKAKTEIKLGLFEQKKEETFEFDQYNLITTGKKYKGLYDLYQNNETYQLVYVCPLVENNKGEDDENKNMTPYAYDVIYLENLDAEAYDLVKKAAAHEKNGLLDSLYIASFACYFAVLLFTIIAIISVCISTPNLTSIVLCCGPLVGAVLIGTMLLPLLIIKYRKYKAE